MNDSHEQPVPRSEGLAKSVLTVFIAMIALGGILTGWWFAQKRSGKDILKISADALDFGRASVQKSFVLHLPIDNISDYTVRVLDIQSSCSCTTVAPKTFVLEAGGTQDVTLTLDLTPGQLKDYNRQVWNFEVEIAVILDGGALQPSPWKVTGQVVSPFRFRDEALVLK